jgi:hypothetical protein
MIFRETWMSPETIRKRRDAKAIPHLQQYAPVWLAGEKVTDEEDMVIFNVVFQHPGYGWVSRRYRYDSVDDVLYHAGQRTLDEAEALAIQEKEPYIDNVQANTPNSYGG